MSDYPIKSPRKLIEVALPLDAINKACAREKSIRHGHPSTLHLWWARRPLAAARAVIFAQLVNDPGYQQGGGFKYGKNKKEAAIERKRLFKIIEDLVLWENTTNEVVLERARAEIRRSWREVCEMNKDHPQAAELFNPDKLPALHDPFAGGGAIPLEAQRLGLEAYASDLNPVAVLINKAMIEIPPKFAGRPPVSILQSRQGAKNKELDLDREWPGATGLAEDVRSYGAWMREEAQKRIGHLYPPVEITEEMAKERPDLKPIVGQKLTVIAWLWARTVKSPNPAFSQCEVPLASTFILSSKPGKDAYIQPVIEGERYHFSVIVGVPPPEASDGTKAKGKGSNFRCILSDTPIKGDYIKAEGQVGRIGTRLMAVVCEGKGRRVYLSPDSDHERMAETANPDWRPDFDISGTTQYLGCLPYGMTKFSQLFTSRQTLALSTFSDLVSVARQRALDRALESGESDDTVRLNDGGRSATAYADALTVFLAFAVDRCADFWSNLCFWANQPKNELVGHLFGRQAIPMAWDFAEVNPFSQSGGNFLKNVGYVAEGIGCVPAKGIGTAVQRDAASGDFSNTPTFISTDPPYFDNVPYADISDYFSVWLRRSMKPVFPELFSTVTVPKADELVAFAYRHKSKEAAASFFMSGIGMAIESMRVRSHPTAPITIYYAFKQSETSDDEGTASTGWVTFLEALVNANLQLVGTWPMRTERSGRMRGNESNALASSIILVCRTRPDGVPSISRRDFIRELNGVLPEALDEMTKGSGDERSPVAPVDLSQAIIGPGMAVFSKYAAVLEADGSPMSVRTALQLINRFLAEDDFDADTQFCLHWFEQHGWTESVFGEADVLARSKSTSVDAMKEAGVLQSGSGKVRLLKWAEYPTAWDPQADTRMPVWEALHHLIRALKQDGESASGALLAALGGKAEAVRQLAYRLYTLCERLGQAEDARAYNELITSWTGIEIAANSVPKPAAPQGTLFDN
jgi:putative DNA methylase